MSILRVVGVFTPVFVFWVPSTAHSPSLFLIEASATLRFGLVFWPMDEQRQFIDDFGTMSSSSYLERAKLAAYHTNKRAASILSFLLCQKTFPVVLKALYIRKNITVKDFSRAGRTPIFNFQQLPKFWNNCLSQFYTQGADAARHSAFELSQWMETVLFVRNCNRWVDLTTLSIDVVAVVFAWGMFNSQTKGRNGIDSLQRFYLFQKK